MSMNYEPYWTTGDFSADLQALAPVKFDLSISLIRNSRRTVIATVLQPTYLAIDIMTLLGGNKSRLKRCNPTRKVVFTTIFFQLVFRGVNSVNIEHLSSESARILPVLFFIVSRCAPCAFHVRKRHTPMQWQGRLMHLWTKRPRWAISHRLDDLWRVQPSWKTKNIWNRNIFWIGKEFKDGKLKNLVLVA